MNHKRRIWAAFVRLVGIEGWPAQAVDDAHLDLELLARDLAIGARLDIERRLFEARRGLPPHCCLSCSAWVGARQEPSPRCARAAWLRDAPSYSDTPCTTNTCPAWSPDPEPTVYRQETQS